ncbi:hypothetical protein [Sandaracinus amylolyticus]|uniref:Basic proline-rich protein n=1 Tax=Sandaracinus amylolyticus TaxID=927083 RepID=A0A0F6YK24_9BACT|nr:hypothetical protein [Sandaracinus amylolyticus]AKF07841.1 Basic proline-rich protein [Sandaracinus amylolyticus]
MGTPERLADVDRELASFGKGDDVLGAVIRRARDAAPSSLDAIDAVLDGLSERRSEPPQPERTEAAAPEPARARPPTPPPPPRPLTARPPPPPARPASSFPRPASIPAAPRVETVPPPGMIAKPATWERPAPIEPPPEDGSGLVQLPDELLRGAALPPVLELDADDPPTATRNAPPVEEEPTDASPAIAARVAAIRAAAAQARDIPPPPRRAASVRPARAPSEAPAPDTTPPGAAAEAFEDTTDIRDPNSLENALLSSDEVIGEEPTGEVALPPLTRDDRPLANLFDDASIAPPPGSVAPGALADLFDDARPEAEPAAHQDLADLLGADLQEALAAGGHGLDGSRPLDDDDATALFGDPLAPRSSLPPRPPGDVLDAQLDSIVGEPMSNAVEPSDMPPSGEFELMIDEDVLVLDDVELGEGESSVGSSDDGEGRIPRSQIPPAMPSSAPPPPPPGTQPKGLISRLLNRK